MICSRTEGTLVFKIVGTLAITRIAAAGAGKARLRLTTSAASKTSKSVVPAGLSPTSPAAVLITIAAGASAGVATKSSCRRTTRDRRAARGRNGLLVKHRAWLVEDVIFSFSLAKTQIGCIEYGVFFPSCFYL